MKIQRFMKNDSELSGADTILIDGTLKNNNARTTIS